MFSGKLELKSLRNNLKFILLALLTLVSYNNCIEGFKAYQTNSVVEESLNSDGSGGLVDTSLPPVVLTSKPDDKKFYEAYIFEMKADDGTILCRIDDDDFKECNLKTQFTNLTAGHHTFSAKAIKDGRQSVLTTYEWDVYPLLKFSAVPASEGTIATVKIELSIASSEMISVKLKSGGGSAESGVDYLPYEKTIQIDKGATSAVASIETSSDQSVESDETIAVGISELINAYSETNSFDITIKNDVNKYYDVEGFRGNVKLVAGAGWGTCLVTKENKLFHSGTEGYSRFFPRDTVDETITQLAGGNRGCYVLTASNKAYAFNQLLEFSKPVKKLTGNYYGPCALLEDSSMECFFNATPTKVIASDVLDISSNDYENCALIKGQGVSCFETSPIEGRKIANVSDSAKIVSGARRYLCHLDGDIVRCGTGTADAEVSGLGKVAFFPDKGSIDLASTSFLSTRPYRGKQLFARTCAIDNSKALKCWFNNAAAVVDGFTSGIQSLTHGFFHMCALTEHGSLKCFGNELGL